MISAYILVIWTVVAHNNYATDTDWRPIGEFVSLESCNAGAAQMNLKIERFRCIKK